MTLRNGMRHLSTLLGYEEALCGGSESVMVVLQRRQQLRYAALDTESGGSEGYHRDRITISCSRLLHHHSVLLVALHSKLTLSSSCLFAPQGPSPLTRLVRGTIVLQRRSET